GATGVTFSGTGVTASITSVTATSISFSIAISSSAATGARSVTVAWPGGLSASLTNAFTVNQVSSCGVTVSGTIHLLATATDNVGVVGVQFKLDGINLGTEDMTAPYLATWNSTTASNGCHTLSAIARDAAGNQG